MNELSWLLYWGGVAGNATAVLVALTLFGGVGFSVWAVISHIEQYGDEYEGPKWLFAIPSVAALLLIFTPNQTTIYAIAASEMGEKVLDSKIATKAEKALDAWLDRQIAGEKE